MREEPPELVALRNALGRELAARREDAKLGQHQVGRRTGYSRSSVAHAETGRQLLTREFWVTVDELVAADGALLARYDEVLAAKAEHERRNREAELARAYAEAQAAARSATTPEGTPDDWRDHLGALVARFVCEVAKRMNRRELHQLLGWVTAALAAFPLGRLNPDEQERVAQALAAPGRVDAKVIDHIEAMLRHCQLQHDALGPQAVVHTVLAQRELVGSLFDECPAEHRARLRSVDSKMCSSLAFYYFDLDDPASAQHYCEQARASAHQAGNTELAVWALCNTSYFASWQGKAHTALDSAAAAQSLVDTIDDPLLRIWALADAGVAYAVDGQHKQCMAAFDRALAGLTSARGQSSPESPVYWNHEGHVLSKQGYCLLLLGKPTEAAATATRSLRLFDSSLVSPLAITTLRLGTARLQCGEVEESVRLVGEGALLATRARSTRLTKEVRTARARLAPWQHLAAVRDLDEQLTATGLST